MHLRDPVRPGNGERLSHEMERYGLRGAAFASDVMELRSSHRSGDSPGDQAPDTGFRACRELAR